MKNRILALIPVMLMTFPAFAEEYPTSEIVQNVIGCMAEMGGQTDENFYTCTCRFDYLKANMSFKEYEDASVFDRNSKMPGERGGFVRDNKEGQKASKDYEKILADAEAQCPVVRHIEAKMKDKPE